MRFLCFVFLTALLGSVLSLATSAAGRPLPEPSKTKEPAVPRELLQAQFETVQVVFTAQWEKFQAGSGTIDEATLWSRRLLDARLAIAATREDRIAACRACLDQMKEIEKVSKSRFDAGRGTIADYKASVYFRIEAEIQLYKAEAK